MTQEQTESVDQFVTRLKQKAEHCNFDNADEQIRDQVIEKCRSSHLRRKLLEKGGDLTLEQTLTTARAFEQSQQQASGIEGGKSLEASVNKDTYSQIQAALPEVRNVRSVIKLAIMLYAVNHQRLRLLKTLDVANQNNM
uniref:Uncharacterized protein LOC111116221 n=1 Tax=Crassostrea virginica TaxID=6565 RepID=A0A8B8C5D3_CRAVI|nr:uncharacterized protein LOC111116221 [Crassostrea virginica]